MTNAVVHAATPLGVTVCVDRDQRELEVAVLDLDARPVLNPVTAYRLQLSY